MTLQPLKNSLRLLKSGLALALIGFFLCMGAASASAEIIDRVVARINDDIVTFHDVKEAAVPYLVQNGVDPEILKDADQNQKVYREVLNDLVDRFLLSQEAKEMGVEVNNKEVDQYMKNLRDQQNLSEDDFRRMVAGYGIDYNAYREMVRQNLLQMRVVRMRLGSQVNVSDEDVEREYQSRYGSGGGETKVAEVRNILIAVDEDDPEAVEAARQKAEAAHQALTEGADFADVARDFSEGPAAKNGGYLGRFSEGDLDPSIEKIVFSLQSGETSKVERTPFGFQIIRVTKLDYEASGDAEERRARIRAELQQQGMEKQMRSFLQRLRTQAFVETSL